jgi:hypothetical protein
MKKLLIVFSILFLGWLIPKGLANDTTDKNIY